MILICFNKLETKFRFQKRDFASGNEASDLNWNVSL